jgi:serine/threonine protein kinase
MATVWRARDQRLGRDVAVKLIAERLLSDGDFVARFEREARIAAGLSHPNLVTVHDFGFDGGRPFLVMELIDGETLAARLERDSLPIDVVALARTMLDVLAAVHDAGIVHRDIKPGNVLYQDDGWIRLTDFGIARILEGTGSSQITETGLVVGTRSYMAPEVQRGAAPTPAADLYSLGVLLAECGAESTPARQLVDRLRAEDPADRPESARLALISIAGLASTGSAPIPDDPTPATAQLDPPAAERDRPAQPERPPASVLDVAERISRPGPSGDRSTRPGLEPAGGPTPQDPDPTPTPQPRRMDERAPAPAPAVSHARPAKQERHGLADSVPTWAGVVAGVVAIGVVLLLVLSLGGGSDEGSSQASTPASSDGKAKEAKSEKPPKPEPAADPVATPPTEPAATEPASGAADPASGSELNDQGYALLQQGDAAGAVPILQQAVDAYGGVDGGDTSDLGFAYALFNLGSALRQSGDPEAAIPVLEKRLEIPDQTETVQAELDLAKKEAGE